MEAFSILKFWRNTVAGGDVITDIDYINSDYQKTPITPTTFSTDVRNRAPDFETQTETEDDNDSFFDLEFTALDGKDKSMNCCKFPESPTDVLRSELNTTSQSPIAILRSAPKFKVLMLRFKKSKTDMNINSTDSSKKEINEPRDNSLKMKMILESNPDDVSKKSENDSRKYLKLIKPLYTVASKRYTSKKLSAVSPLSSSSSPATVACSSPRRSSDEKRNNKGSSFKVVYKHLGKSRSANSSAAGVVTCPVKRRDDSLLLHNDGIQSAILHCKRSYNSSNEGLSRCSLDESPEKSVIEEPKRCSI